MTTETKHMPSEREIEAATEALARTALTLKGKIECVWPDDWSHEECAKLRNGAIAALTAASQSRAPDQSERVRELEAALAEARKVIGAVQGHLLNALIDLQTATPKKTTISALKAGIKITRDWDTRNPESSK